MLNRNATTSAFTQNGSISLWVMMQKGILVGWAPGEPEVSCRYRLGESLALPCCGLIGPVLSSRG